MRKVALALLACCLLCSGSALGQTVTDVGEVAVDGDGNLSIGVDGFGSRTVDAASDGPYTSVLLGVNSGSSGELTLENAASFSTPGNLALGSSGSGLVEVRGGSQVSSGSTDLGAALGGSASMLVSGSGSEWSNTGPLNLSQFSSSLRVSDGALVSTGGISSSTTVSNILIEGSDSVLRNAGQFSSSGILRNLSSPAVAVRDGGSMIDTGLSFLQFDQSPVLAFQVTGSGSRWTTGDMNLVTAEFSIEAGGVVEGGSLSLSARENGSESFVIGNGTALNLSGSLSMFDSQFPIRLSLEEGARLVTHGADVNTTGGVSVDGLGSTWENLGDLEIALLGTTSFGPGLSITGGALLSNRNADYRSCGESGLFRCIGINVSGNGSLWHTSGNVSLKGPTSIQNGGTLFVGNRLDVLSGDGLGNGELSLDAGLVQASTLVVDDGRLTGQGLIESHVTNNGTLDPGDSERQMPGVLSIDGTYSQDATGTLEILLTGSAAHELDKVTVTGTVALAGELTVSVGAGFTTQLGDRFTILEYADRTGEFDSVSGLQLGDGLSLRPVYSAEAMYLVTIPEPSTVLLLGAGLALLGALRNRH